MINKTRKIILEYLIKNPFLGRYILYFYSKLGVKHQGKCTIDRNVTIISNYNNISLGANVTIRSGVMFVAYDKIEIGDNTGIGYQTLILTSAVPGGPHNKLYNIYKRIKKTVIIGHDSWIGARVTIFPGVKIGNYCVVAAGSVVREDVKDYSVVAGVPAKVVKKLDPECFK